MRYMSWTAYDTAGDFRARLRFPRAGAEPPRRLRSNQLLEGTKQIKLYSPSQKNEPLIKHV